MGYYTHFELTVHDYGNSDVKDKDIIEAIKKIRETVKNAFYSFWDEIKETDKEDFDCRDLSLETSESVKWYDSEQEMVMLSKIVPGVVFKLHGEGEESGDVWDEYYLDGKSCRYIPVMPEFDPNDLK